VSRFQDIFTEVQTLPTLHRAIRLTAGMLLDSDIAIPLTTMVRGRLHNSISSRDSVVGVYLEVPNWNVKDGPMVPAYPSDWLVEVEGVWMVFDTPNFEQVFREHSGLIVVHERSLTEGP